MLAAVWHHDEVNKSTASKQEVICCRTVDGAEAHRDWNTAAKAIAARGGVPQECPICFEAFRSIEPNHHRDCCAADGAATPCDCVPTSSSLCAAAPAAQQAAVAAAAVEERAAESASLAMEAVAAEESGCVPAPSAAPAAAKQQQQPRHRRGGSDAPSIGGCMGNTAPDKDASTAQREALGERAATAASAAAAAGDESDSDSDCSDCTQLSSSGVGNTHNDVHTAHAQGAELCDRVGGGRHQQAASPAALHALRGSDARLYHLSPEVAVAAPCGHAFHSICLIQYEKHFSGATGGKPVCPVCRAPYLKRLGCEIPSDAARMRAPACDLDCAA